MANLDRLEHLDQNIQKTLVGELNKLYDDAQAVHKVSMLGVRAKNPSQLITVI